MEAQSFCYWLKGYVELNGTTPTEAQWKIIVDHLEKVFDKQTPNRDNGITTGPATDQLARPPEFRIPSYDWSKLGHPGGITPAIIC